MSKGGMGVAQANLSYCRDLGGGGVGKSFLINKITQRSGINVVAPSGAAAHNVNGCTLHSLLYVDVNFPNANLSEVKRKQLLARLKHTLVLIIDKWSQLEKNCL
mmetsp:Transcript_20134/g.36945  ORF Transcript_20134/g.36945 Transcript_20134/m.36945 type:complete len:104 (-) Transcript_20134:9-320(-)